MRRDRYVEQLDRIDAALDQWGARGPSVEEQAYSDWIDSHTDITSQPAEANQ